LLFDISDINCYILVFVPNLKGMVKSDVQLKFTQEISGDIKVNVTRYMQILAHWGEGL
jgi:hypothetical protein